MFRRKLFSVNNVTVFKRTMSIKDVKEIFQKSVEAVLPTQLIKNEVQVCNRHLSIRGQSYELKKPCYVIGFGKAVLGMALEIERILGKTKCIGVVSLI